MKTENFFFLLFFLPLLFAAKCRHVATDSSTCPGKVSSVFMIEKADQSGPCLPDDMSEMRSWIENCNIDSGIILFYNTDSCSDNPDFQAIAKSGKFDFIFFNDHRDTGISQSDMNMSLENVRISSPLSFPISFHDTNISPGADNAVSGISTANSNILYLSNFKPLFLGALQTDIHFKSVIRKYGFDSVALLPNMLQGGDVLTVGNHIFLGQGSLYNFSVAGNPCVAEDSIRKIYRIPKDHSIDFLITSDSAIYHLDLFVTYAGVNKKGKHQFFMAYLGNTNNTIFTISQRGKRLSASLRDLYPKFDKMLKKRFKDMYQLDTVPVYLGVNFISPLNGILDCEKIGPLYYMPYPSDIEDSPDNIVDVRSVVDTAFNIMSDKVNVKKIYVQLEDMVATNSSGGQSLHCSMSILRRK